MSDFGTMVTSMKSDALDPADTDAMKRHIVAALKNYRGIRFEFAEKIGTFSTVADQEAYTPGAGGVPSAIFQIDRLQLTVNGRDVEIRMVPWLEYRNRKLAAATVHQPRIGAWYAGKLYLYPTPGAVYTVTIDYLFDATRDTATGNEITTASGDTVTNEFFTTAEELLRTRALYTWGLTRGVSDPLATRMKLLNNEAMAALQRRAALVRANNRQAPAYF